MIALLLAASLDGPPGDPARGADLAGLGGCPACHTAPGGAPMAGGVPIDTEWGTFYGTNLTPDPTHGLGAWGWTDFTRAMRDGRAPDGRPLWPVFPFDAFSRVDDRDLADLWAWLRSLTPDPTPDRPHELAGAARLPTARSSWRLLAFRPQQPTPSPPSGSARGGYLAEGLGHCGGCHTPRSAVGVPSRSRPLAGSPHGPDIASSASEVSQWTVSELAEYLGSGMTPDGDFAGGEMARVIREGTARLPDSDRQAIAEWLRAQPDAFPHGR